MPFSRALVRTSFYRLPAPRLVDAAHVQTCGDSLPVIDMVARLAVVGGLSPRRRFSPSALQGRHGRFADAALPIVKITRLPDS